MERKRSLSEIAPYQDTSVVVVCMCDPYHAPHCPNWEQNNYFYRELSTYRLPDLRDKTKMKKTKSKVRLTVTSEC